jgi:hypothetical protein
VRSEVAAGRESQIKQAGGSKLTVKISVPKPLNDSHPEVPFLVALWAGTTPTVKSCSNVANWKKPGMSASGVVMKNNLVGRAAFGQDDIG